MRLNRHRPMSSTSVLAMPRCTYGRALALGAKTPGRREAISHQVPGNIGLGHVSAGPSFSRAVGRCPLIVVRANRFTELLWTSAATLRSITAPRAR